jgi:hypothetical protein
VVVVVEVVASELLLPWGNYFSHGGIIPPMWESLLPWGNYISHGGITSPMEEHPFIHPLIN